MLDDLKEEEIVNRVGGRFKLSTLIQKRMVALKGYRTVGGIRASIYNAMPVAGARALADFMKSFAQST